MLKFIWGKGHPPTAERIRVQKELFDFQQEVRHGFPHKPSCMAWDAQLRLLAIATRNGTLRVFGAPGVEFISETTDDVIPRLLLFVPGRGQIVMLSEKNSITLWNLSETGIEETRSLQLEAGLRNVSSMCIDVDHHHLILGTEIGSLCFVSLDKFVVEDSKTLSQSKLLNSASIQDFKLNPGAVESITLHPTRNNEALIGFSRGLILHLDIMTATVLHSFVAKQQLECVAIGQDGNEFVSVHNDGSFITWTTDNGLKKEGPTTPFGPYPCKAITKVAFNSYVEEGVKSDLLVFSGGMPRASYGDKFTVTLIKNGDSTTVFDLTSKVIDFELVTQNDDNHKPECLIILGEEELVVVDLISPNLPVFELPYLNAIHSSAVTALEHVSNVRDDVVKALLQAKQQDSNDSDDNSRKKERRSSRPWPINGGCDESGVKTNIESGNKVESLLLTGHEDGSVKLWVAKGSVLLYLGCVQCSKLFHLEDDELNDGGEDLKNEDEDEDEEEEWPPFRRIGHYDPYSDDPRLAVKRIVYNKDKLIVGLTAGQVCVFELSGSPLERNNGTKVIECQLITETEGFTWKGHDALCVHKGPMKIPKGFQASFVIQVKPPASINALTSNEEWGLIAVGTAHGLVLVDSLQQCLLIAKCTLNAQDISSADDNPWSRRNKSLKKSLRESFRRLRKGRSQRNNNKKATTAASDPVKRELMAHQALGDLSSRHVARFDTLDEASRRSRMHQAHSYDNRLSHQPKKAMRAYGVLEWTDDSRDESVDTLSTESTVASVQKARDKGVQTEKIGVQGTAVESQDGLMSALRRVSSVSRLSCVSSSLSLRVPEWYWSGHPSIPSRLRSRRSTQSLVSQRSRESRLAQMKLRWSNRANSASTWMRSFGQQARSLSSSVALSHLAEGVENVNSEDESNGRIPQVVMKKPSILNQVEEPSRNAVKLQIIQQVGQTLSNVVTNDSSSNSNEIGEGGKEKRLWDPIRDSIMERKRKRELEKMWTTTYLGMCNRATVLNDAVEKARKEELEIRPIHTHRASQLQLPSKGVGGGRRRECVGLEKPFYDLNAPFPTPSSSILEMSINGDDLVSPTHSERCAPSLDLASTAKRTVANAGTMKMNASTIEGRSQSLPFKLDVMALRDDKPYDIDACFHRRTSSNDYRNQQSRSFEPKQNQRSSKSQNLDVERATLIDPSASRTGITSNDTARSITLVNRGVQVEEASLFVNHRSGILYSSRCESPELRQPVERQVEARSGAENGLGSMVRCLHFANTFIANSHTPSYTLWAGTNSGQVLAFIITLATKDRRKKEKCSVILGKEIQLRHKAPVISIQVVDSHGLPVGQSSLTISSLPHRILIASEEQFKTFVLPTLKPACKYKLTAHEGSRIRAVGFATFVSKSDKRTKENCLLCLTNQGDLVTHSLPELRRQVQTNCIRREDVIAIASLVFTDEGEAFYQCSSSEIQRVTMAANKVLAKTKPKLTLDKRFNDNKGSMGTNKDVHNETVVSDVSADITLDSVRDHTTQVVDQQQQQQMSKRSVTEVQEHSASSLTATTSSISTTSVTATTITVGEQEGRTVEVSSTLTTVNVDNA